MAAGAREIISLVVTGIVDAGSNSCDGEVLAVYMDPDICRHGPCSAVQRAAIVEASDLSLACPGVRPESPVEPPSKESCTFPCELEFLFTGARVGYEGGPWRKRDWT